MQERREDCSSRATVIDHDGSVPDLLHGFNHDSTGLEVEVTFHGPSVTQRIDIFITQTDDTIALGNEAIVGHSFASLLHTRHDETRRARFSLEVVDDLDLNTLSTSASSVERSTQAPGMFVLFDSIRTTNAIDTIHD
jgi:hypothetical protein